MKMRHDPFEGKTVDEIAKIIYNTNESKDDDANDAIQFLGGVDNIIGFEELSYVKAREKIKQLNVASNYFYVAVQDFKKTVFAIENCSLRYVNCQLNVFHIDRECYVEVGKDMIKYIKALGKYYGNRK